MFIKARLTRELALEPRFMGKYVQKMVQERLKEAVEGKVIPNVGYIIRVLSIDDSWIGNGIVDNDTGSSVYKITYEALLFQTFQNEVLDMAVTTVNSSGFKATAGNMFNVFIHRLNMASNGPQDPSRFEDEAWVSPDGTVRIRKKCGVRLRVHADPQYHPTEISGIANMKDDYTGLVYDV